MGSGVGQFVPSDLPAGGITLTNAAGIGAAPIAEWVLGRVLSVYKRFDEHAAQQLRHEWVEALGALLEGRTVLMVGVGAIGAAVAVRFRAFGVHTIGVKRSYTPGMTDPAVDELIGPADLLATLPRGGRRGRGGARDRGQRAPLRRDGVRRDAPGRGVRQRRPGNARRRGGAPHRVRPATSAVRRSTSRARNRCPPTARSGTAPNLWDSPHSSASADRYLERVVDLFVDNLGRYTSGQPLRNVVDLSAGY